MSFTIKEIAIRAGVSKSTVSRVISGKGYTSPEAREKVLSVIKMLQYKPNAVARAMVSQRTNNIGVIIYRDRLPIVSHPFYGKILDAIISEAEQLNYSVVVTTDREMSLRSADFMLEKRVDGLILISRLRHNVIEYIKGFGVPYLMVNGSTDDESVVHLVNRDVKGGELAADYYAEQGFRRIVVIAGPQEHRSHYFRRQGFMNRLNMVSKGIGTGSVYYSEESSFESGYQVMVQHWKHFQKQRYRALFATNDMLALGAMKFLQEQGLLIPKDLAVMGYDDIAMAEMVHPALTSIRVETPLIGRDAVRILSRLMNEETIKDVIMEYEPALVIRDSTTVY